MKQWFVGLVGVVEAETEAEAMLVAKAYVVGKRLVVKGVELVTDANFDPKLRLNEEVDFRWKREGDGGKVEPHLKNKVKGRGWNEPEKVGNNYVAGVCRDYVPHLYNARNPERCLSGYGQ